MNCCGSTSSPRTPGIEYLPSDYPVVHSAKARTSTTIAPSWSWASVAEGHIYPSDIGRHRRSFEFELLETHVVAADFGPFASVNADVALYSDIANPTVEFSDVKIVGYGVTDPVDTALPPNTRFTCLAIATDDVFGKVVVEGLLLLPIELGAFRRVGFLRTEWVDEFQVATKRIIELH
ncbi:hypothetical protein T440DRAFT_481250 [Plenodomus tracheiphilus IPT5]|uniref:Uncharacterized protein n=1 Tax=Plenodomus tracheiphilus IPT5 TaxID=1408161 RepID=A0A6A7AXT8_9PLEO|nr:hypothetical protein T440DRAFT_481250 [Plenodomus tracheiphilus IPT5]